MLPPHGPGGTEVNTDLQPNGRGAVLRLSAVSGPGAGRALGMVSALATVGRHPTNDLVVGDPRVSGVHLELRRAHRGLHVRDAGSTNGTWMGPHRVTEIELAPGGELTIGATLLRLNVHDEGSPPALATAQSFGDLVGRSPAMRELFATLERIAAKNLSVLLQGETGTGKEAVARALHARSLRADKPFVVIDAAALPEKLAESLLFGHEKGAFTGAERRTVGLFEAGNGGTVFLDEIGELPLGIEAKFLRVLERREVTRVGSHEPMGVDVRVVAATHRDLRHEIEAGRFREDLFFRLAQLRIMLPPLRDRPEDVRPLCERFLTHFAGQSGPALHIEAEALQHLQAQPWPGNVRELRNVLARAAALATNTLIRRGDVAGEGSGFRGTREERSVLDLTGTFSEAKERAIARFESAYLAALMKRCAGNLSHAALAADLVRHHLRELLKKRGLYRESAQP